MADSKPAIPDLSGEIKSRPAEEVEGWLKVLSKLAHAAAEEAVPSAFRRFLVESGYTPGVSALADVAEEMSGEPRDEILTKALNLYIGALEEDRRGNRLVVLNRDDEIVREVVGVGPQRVGSEPAA